MIPSFLETLEWLAPAEHEQLHVAAFGPIPAYALEDDDSDWWSSEAASYLLEELEDLLSDNAPAYCVFGPSEGGGSDFGFWPDWWEVDGGVEDGEILKVSDLADVPEDWQGLVLVVNDHGNATLYDADGSQVWGVV